MTIRKFVCPACQTSINIKVELLGESIRCPGCDRNFANPAARSNSATKPDALADAQQAAANPATTTATQTAASPAVRESESEAHNVDHLLPPKFHTTTGDQNGVNDPDLSQVVVLPTPDGGTVAVDADKVHIVQDGEVIALKVLPRAKKSQRRAMRNAISIIVGLAVLALAFVLLT